jgi:hypothetical protein
MGLCCISLATCFRHQSVSTTYIYNVSSKQLYIIHCVGVCSEVMLLLSFVNK